MKATACLCLGFILSVDCLVVSAKDSPLRYKFAAGETNVYRIEVEQRMEGGTSSNFGNIVVSPLAVSSNLFKLGFRGNVEVRNTAGDRGFPPYFGGSRWSGNSSLGDSCELQFDGAGNILRMTSDYPLPLPLGSVLTELIQPLPAGGKGEVSEKTFVVDAPLWLGPSPILFSTQPYGPPYYMNYGPRQNLAAVAVLLRTEWKTLSVASNLVTLQKKVALQSTLKFNNEPQITASGEGVVVFDLQAGMIVRVNMSCASHGSSETVSRENRVTLTLRRLEGQERADVLQPPPPPVVPQAARKLSPDEVQAIIVDLKSSDLDKQRAAINRVRDVELESPQPELAELVATFALNEDTGVRQSVAGFLLKNGTTNQVPALVRQLKDSDDNVVQTAAKALARLKDGRAIEPLVELLASGLRLNQFNQIQNYQFIPDIAAAIQGIGAPAEGAVVVLLAERNGETRRQACLILKQIGTPASLESLQKVVGDPNPLVNQAAADAIRAIKQRQ